ncbi:MAG: hypothetical protein ACLUEZ_11255 [Oscillospiraceae bacterium]
MPRRKRTSEEIARKERKKHLCRIPLWLIACLKRCTLQCWT